MNYLKNIGLFIVNFIVGFIFAIFGVSLIGTTVIALIWLLLEMLKPIYKYVPKENEGILIFILIVGIFLGLAYALDRLMNSFEDKK